MLRLEIFRMDADAHSPAWTAALTWRNRYLLIEYHIAELVSRLSTPNRNAALTVAQVSYEKYLRGLQAYDVLSDQDQKMYDQYLENPQTFSTASTTDLAARRQAKIERFRREKEWKQKLEHLQRMPDALRDDESRVRDLHLMRIRLSTHQAFASLESIAQELHVRSLAASYTAPAEPGQAGDDRVRVRLGGGGGDYSERVDPPLAQLLAAGGRGPMLDGEGRPLQPFTLLDKRDQLRQGVFRPGHNLPTMTIDEYLAEERRRGGIIDGGGPMSGRGPEPDEDDMDQADEETIKARAWDEFTEANPRGSGNTMNRG
ncbi:MAG: hypothetical protein M1826_002206 [Phylliscum demangeonii]|nr:MAG: hypothetical protein M1826_002206 [Phylliscum demangeonii]